MKVKQTSAGSLTNFEVLDFLRSRGVSRAPTRLIASEDNKSEFVVYDYLVSSAACNQTRESINEFLKKCEKYDLAKAEKLNIINTRPSSVVEFQPIIEECEKRMTDEVVAELAELVVDVLPPPPTQHGTEEENIEENPDIVVPPPPTQSGTEEQNMEENPDIVFPPLSTQPGTEDENMEENPDIVFPPLSTQPGTEDENMEENPDG